MPFDPNKHHRRSTRLPGFDYTEDGAYFVTICTAKRVCLFGNVTETGKMILNDLGSVVEKEWLKSAEIRKEIVLDNFIVMPNYVHGIVMIIGDPPIKQAVGAQGLAPLQSTTLFRPPRSLGSFIAGFKMAVTTQINTLRKTPSVSIWQRNFHDKIIWNEPMLNGIRAYI